MELKTANELPSTDSVLQLWKGFRREVLEYLKKTPNAKFIESPSPGKWSVSEIAEHLYLTQFNLARTAPIVMAKKFGRDFDEQKDLEYEKIRDAFLKPTGVKNPENVEPLNKYTLVEILDLLEKSEKKMESALKKYSKSELQTRGFDHPILGPLNLFNWFWVLALHEHSHLVALKEKIAKY